MNIPEHARRLIGELDDEELRAGLEAYTNSAYLAFARTLAEELEKDLHHDTILLAYVKTAIAHAAKNLASEGIRKVGNARARVEMSLLELELEAFTILSSQPQAHH